jgi:hypothetical protein
MNQRRSNSAYSQSKTDPAPSFDKKIPKKDTILWTRVLRLKCSIKGQNNGYADGPDRRKYTE